MVKFLTNPQAIGTTVFLIVVDQFGTECLNWETDTLWDEMDKLVSDDVPLNNKEEASALGLIYTSDRFFNNPTVFSRISNTLGGENTPTVAGVFDPPDVDEMAWTVWESLLHRPLERNETEEDRFGSQVQTFIRELLITRGFLLTPSPLDFVDLPSSPPGLENLDPDLTQAAWELQRKNRNIVTGYVKERITRLLNQLEKVQLKNGHTDQLVERLHQLV